MGKLVIFGAGEFAHIAYEYFSHDSDYDVAAFVVDDSYHHSDTFQGISLIPLSKMASEFPNSDFEVFVALTATNMNKDRTRLFRHFKSEGYKLATYISSHAFVWRNVSIGENTFIFENNVLQPFVSVGDNCILWSGNHIGHRTVIKDNVFVSSHVVLSGYCVVEDNCYFGVNATVHNNIHIARDCIVGAGSMIRKDTTEGLVYVGVPAQAIPGKTSFDIKF